MQDAAYEISAIGGAVIAVPTDVTDEAQVKALFETTMSRFGRLDILVNNAGSVDGGRVDELSLEKFQHVMNVNVTGPFLCTRQAFRIMKEAGGGRITNISSSASNSARPSSTASTTHHPRLIKPTQVTV